MSSDQDASYYEIALTNRQVLTIFIVLLTCLVAAFLSGVWIGRGGGGEVQAALEEPLAEADDASQLAELNFFSDAPPLDGAVRPGSAPRRPDPTQSQPSEPVPATGPPASTPPPAADRPPAEPAAEPPAPSTPGGPVIQVFSTADAAQARRLVQRLGAGGYPVYLLEESLQGQKMFRVRVGPYREESEARQVAEELRRQFRLDTWITSQQPG